MRSFRGAAITGAALVVASLSLTACTEPPHACSSVGWFNRIEVQVTGNAAPVARLDFCAGFDSTPGPNRAPDPTTSTHTGDTWNLYTDMTTPKLGRIAAIDAQGGRLVESEVALNWKRVGGTAECGGPEVAYVDLIVP